MKTLIIDIETSPNLAHVWSLWNQNVSLSQLIESTEILCFAAKWRGESKIFFHSVFHDSREEMLRIIYDLLEQADAVVHYNGKRFDIPHINGEIATVLKAGPPAPFKQIDILETVKKRFRFPSNKLEYVLKVFGLPEKIKHEGHTLWIRCMAGDKTAWKEMKHYNIRDITGLEELYEQILPWIIGHPSFGAMSGEDVCPACGSDDLERQGYAYTAVSKFQRWKCRQCGKWSRSSKRVHGSGIQAVADV